MAVALLQYDRSQCFNILQDDRSYAAILRNRFEAQKSHSCFITCHCTVLSNCYYHNDQLNMLESYTGDPSPDTWQDEARNGSRPPAPQPCFGDQDEEEDGFQPPPPSFKARIRKGPAWKCFDAAMANFLALSDRYVRIGSPFFLSQILFPLPCLLSYLPL